MRERMNKKDDGGGGNYFSSPKTNLEFISSGCKLLDLALGGGWVEGRIANIIGDKSTGKTLLCIEACANFAAKHLKGRMYYRESEAAFDEGYAEALGMPVRRIDFGDPLETVEDLFADLQRIVEKSTQPGLYICDSLDALSDKGEMARDMDQGSFGAEKAKKMSQLFRRLVRKLEDKQITVIIVSQVRDKIGAMFGRKWSRTGGRALDFYASQVIYLAHLGTLKRTVSKLDRAVGVKVKAKVDKNKVGLPFREAEFQIQFGYGIDDVQASLNWLKECDGLKDTGIIWAKDYGMSLLDMAPIDAKKKADLVNNTVQHKWWAIEHKLMPSKQKYGS